MFQTTNQKCIWVMSSVVINLLGIHQEFVTGPVSSTLDVGHWFSIIPRFIPFFTLRSTWRGPQKKVAAGRLPCWENPLELVLGSITLTVDELSKLYRFGLKLEAQFNS